MSVKRVIQLASMLAMVASISACGLQTAKQLDSQVPDLSFDIHEVEYSPVPAKYNIASYSHINRDVNTKATDLVDVRQVTSGSSGDWQWEIYADKDAYNLVQPFATRQKITVPGKDGPREIVMPSWNDVLIELTKGAHAVIGDRIFPLEVRLTFVGQQVNFEKFITHNDYDHAILDYYIGVYPDNLKDGASKFQWMANTIATVGHEYSHTFIDVRNIDLPNALTDEVMAYTFEQCMKAVIIGSQGGIAFLDQDGKHIDPKHTSYANLVHKYNSASFDAYYLAEYDTVNFLGTDSIAKDDTASKEKFLGLCSAMYAHINDFKKGYYPSDLVKPLQYDWNSYH